MLTNAVDKLFCIKVTEAEFRVFFFSGARKDKSCVLKLDADEYSHKTTNLLFRIYKQLHPSSFCSSHISPLRIVKIQTLNI